MYFKICREILEVLTIVNVRYIRNGYDLVYYRQPMNMNHISFQEYHDVPLFIEWLQHFQGKSCINEEWMSVEKQNNL